MKFSNQYISSFRQFARQGGATFRFAKYYRQWERCLRPGTTALNERIPWINFPAIDFLRRNLKPTDIVFEYGGGGSTLFFLDQVGKVITIEHNPEWFEQVAQKLTDGEKKRWEGHLILPQPGANPEMAEPSEPDHYSSADESSSGFSFKNYVSSIDVYENKSLDLVLIDGRSRPSCIRHAANKVKTNGLLFLDNADRTYYLEKTVDDLKDFQLLQSISAPTPFITYFVQTNIYKRIN